MWFPSFVSALLVATTLTPSTPQPTNPTKLKWAGGANWNGTYNGTSLQAGGPTASGMPWPSAVTFRNLTSVKYTFLRTGLSQPVPTTKEPLVTMSPVVIIPLTTSSSVVNTQLAGTKTSGLVSITDSPTTATSITTTSGALQAPQPSATTAILKIIPAPVSKFPMGPELEKIMWEIIYDFLRMLFRDQRHHLHHKHRFNNGTAKHNGTVIPFHRLPVGNDGFSNGQKAIIAAVGTMIGLEATVPVFIDAFCSAQGLEEDILKDVILSPLIKPVDPISAILSPLKNAFSSLDIIDPLNAFHRMMEQRLQAEVITDAAVEGMEEMARNTLGKVTYVFGRALSDIAEESGESAEDIIGSIATSLKDLELFDESTTTFFDSFVSEFSQDVESFTNDVEAPFMDLADHVYDEILARVNRQDLYDDPSSDSTHSSSHGGHSDGLSDDKPADDVQPVDQNKPSEEEQPASDDKPAEEEKPASDKKPTEEDQPVEEKQPAENHKPAEKEKPAQEEEPTQGKKSAQDDKPAEEEKPEEERPVKEKKPAEEEQPVVEKEKEPVKEEDPKEKTPADTSDDEEQDLEPLGLQRKLLKEIRQAEKDAEERRLRFIEGDHFPEPPRWDEWQQNLQRLIRFEHNRGRLNQLIQDKYRLAQLRADWEAEWQNAPEQGGGNLGKGKDPAAPWNNAPSLEARLELLKQKLEDKTLSIVQAFRIRQQIRELEMQIQGKLDSEKMGKPPALIRRDPTVQVKLLDAVVSGLKKLESDVAAMEFGIATSTLSTGLPSSTATSDSTSPTSTSISSTRARTSSAARISISDVASSFPSLTTTRFTEMVNSTTTITGVVTTSTTSTPSSITRSQSATASTTVITDATTVTYRVTAYDPTTVINRITEHKLTTEVNRITAYKPTTVYDVTTINDVHTEWYMPHPSYAPGHLTRTVVPSPVPTPKKTLTPQQKYRLEIDRYNMIWGEPRQVVPEKFESLAAEKQYFKDLQLAEDWYMTSPPHAHCVNFYTILFLSINITELNSWAGRDYGASLWHEVGGCGLMTAKREQYDPLTGLLYGISFQLPVLMHDGCVGRAIETAGGPHMWC